MARDKRPDTGHHEKSRLCATMEQELIEGAKRVAGEVCETWWSCQSRRWLASSDSGARRAVFSGGNASPVCHSSIGLTAAAALSKNSNSAKEGFLEEIYVFLGETRQPFSSTIKQDREKAATRYRASRILASQLEGSRPQPASLPRPPQDC